MDFSSMRSNNVVVMQQVWRDYGRAVSAKRLTLKEYEAFHAPFRRIGNTLLRPGHGHIQVTVA
jgi:hypothetical protein